MLQSRLKSPDAHVLSEAEPGLMVPGILMLTVQPVVLQRIDDLGNVRLAQGGAFNPLQLAPMLELQRKAQVSGAHSSGQ